MQCCGICLKIKMDKHAKNPKRRLRVLLEFTSTKVRLEDGRAVYQYQHSETGYSIWLYKQITSQHDANLFCHNFVTFRSISDEGNVVKRCGFIYYELTGIVRYITFWLCWLLQLRSRSRRARRLCAARNVGHACGGIAKAGCFLGNRLDIFPHFVKRPND